ncbi:MAG: hypothetical protein AB7V42_08580 [Thermoleophilia bacterium]
MSHRDEIPESVREYFGHDKVALHGSGGLPAAPPAPPGSTARRAGEHARDDALSKVGTPGVRPGQRPAAIPPKARLPRAMRSSGERALMERSQARLGPSAGAPPPHGGAGWFWRSLFAPVYSAIPWAVKKRMVSITSGVKGWRS